MSIANKPTDQELLTEIQELWQFPEYINELDVLKLKRLLSYIETLIKSKLSEINQQLINCDLVKYEYPAEYKNGNEFKYWAERISRFGFNYYALNKINSNILQRLINLDQNLPSEDLTPLNNKFEYSHFFKAGALEKFLYLKDNYPFNDTHKTIKYALIYEVLMAQLNVGRDPFAKFLKEVYEDELQGYTFSKIELTGDKSTQIKEPKKILKDNFK